MSYPSFFLGEVPSLDEESAESLTASEAFQIGFEAGAEHVAEHLRDYNDARVVANRGSIAKTYNDLKLRMDWLHNVFAGLSPNPTGE